MPVTLLRLTSTGTDRTNMEKDLTSYGDDRSLMAVTPTQAAASLHGPYCGQCGEGAVSLCEEFHSTQNYTAYADEINNQPKIVDAATGPAGTTPTITPRVAAADEAMAITRAEFIEFPQSMDVCQMIPANVGNQGAHPFISRHLWRSESH